jgi:hypothetical protein
MNVMAHNPRSSDGSAPAIGELVSEASGAKPRRRTVPAGFSTSNFGTGPSADAYRQHAEAAAQAAAAYNTGAADGSAPVPGLEEYVAGNGSGRAVTSWADPSSLSK